MFIEGKKERKNELVSVQQQLKLATLCMGRQDLRCAWGQGLGAQPCLQRNLCHPWSLFLFYLVFSRAMKRGTTSPEEAWVPQVPFLCELQPGEARDADLSFLEQGTAYCHLSAYWHKTTVLQKCQREGNTRILGIHLQKTVKTWKFFREWWLLVPCPEMGTA